MAKHWQRFALALTAVALVGAGCTTSTTTSETTTETTTDAAPATTTSTTTTPSTTTGSGTSVGVQVGEPTAKTYTVEMSGDKFSPGSVTINAGDTVTFKNVGSNPHWPASAPHPTHTTYPEFDPKHEIAAGQSWSFTFDKVGTWRYHDHLNSGVVGVIIVK
jgi:plastocyanin